MKPVLLKTALTVSGLLLGLLLAEAGLRAYGALLRHSGRGADNGGGRVILCAGDSFTYGIGAPAGESYPDSLQRLLDAKFGDGAYRVVNAGVPAQNSSELAANMEALLEKYRPAVLLVLTGTNNYSLRDSNFFLFAPSEVSRAELLALKTDALLSEFKLYRLLKYARASALRSLKPAYSTPPCADGAQAALSGAFKKFDARDFKGAAASLETALKENPSCAELHFQAGRMQFYFRDFPAAFAHFRKGKTLNPDHPFVKLFLSQEIPLLRPETASAALDRLLDYDLGLVSAAAKRSGARLVIQTYPFATDGGRDYIRKAAAKRLGADVVDQRAVFLPLTAGVKFREYLSGDEPDLMASHPNAKGYRLMAEVIYSEGIKAGFFSPPAVLR